MNDNNTSLIPPFGVDETTSIGNYGKTYAKALIINTFTYK
jgi:hypothetical protein